MDHIEIGGRLQRRAYALESPIEVDEAAILLEVGGARQYDVGGKRRLREEYFRADNEVADAEGGTYMSAVRAGLHDVLAEYVQRLKVAAQRRVEHFRDSSA